MQTQAQRTSLIRSDTVKQWFGDISDMTLWRWVTYQGFPKPMKICGRNYWNPSDIERWQSNNAR